MIARTWKGRVPASKADAYYTYLLKTGLAEYRATPGNLGILVQRRVDGNVAHFELTTLWDSFDSIRTFAGEQYEKARYYPEDDAFLLERNPGVEHAEVLMVAFEAEPRATSAALSR